MTLSQSFQMLQLAESASLDDVKRAYRKLAFKYHPDLNNGDPAANRKFQQLNEAYVILQKHFAGEDVSGGGRSSSQWTGGAGGRTAGRSDGRSGGRTAGSGRTGPGHDAWAEEQARRAHRGRSSTAGGTGPTSGKTSEKSRNFFYKQEEVLKDILNDPFAKKVFEDIYSKLKREGRASSADATPVAPKKRKLNLEWGSKKLSLDLSQGVTGSIKGWVRSWFDYEQTIELPAMNLLPGRKVRIKVARGMSNEERTIEVRLPSDFVVGRPIRLKGLGRHLGPFKGDLYLRLMPK